MFSELQLGSGSGTWLGLKVMAGLSVVTKLGLVSGLVFEIRDPRGRIIQTLLVDEIQFHHLSTAYFSFKGTNRSPSLVSLYIEEGVLSP